MFETIIKRCALVACLFFVAGYSCRTWAQGVEQVQRVMFYNCENLFDPENDPDSQDDEFTPEGARHWTPFRQYAKMLNIGKAILAAGEGRIPSLVGLAEVENDSVLLRLTRGTPLRKWEYAYVMTHSQDVRGINVALMYQPMDFRLLGYASVRVPMAKGARPTRDILHAWGRILGGDTLDVVVCHLPSRLGGAKASAQNRSAAQRTIRRLNDSLSVVRLHPHVLVMGDMNDYPDTKSLGRAMCFGQNLHNLMEPLQRDLKRGKRAFGSHKYDGQWGFLDQVWINDGLLPKAVEAAEGQYAVWVDSAEVVCLPFMLTEDASHLGHRPFRSYNGYRYEGGFSDHLPVRVDLHIRRL